jgi:hypothetical protein
MMGIDASARGRNALIRVRDQSVVTGECNFTSDHTTNNMTVGRTTILGRTVKMKTRLGGTAGSSRVRTTVTKRSVLRRVAVGDDHGDRELGELVS